MHYIIGTKISIIRTVVKPGATNKINLQRSTREFKPGNIYELWSIRKNDDDFTYKFRNLTDRSIVEKNFKSVGEGDAFIAELKKEQIPNYTEFYRSLDSNNLG